MRWVQNGARCMRTFQLRCYNPDCLHEYEFTQDMAVASQTNWICPRCDLDLFSHVDLGTPSDDAFMDMVSELFTPSPVKKNITSPCPLPVNLFNTPSPFRQPPGNDENKKPSPDHSIISVSSSDSPWKDDGPLFLPPGPYLTIQGLADARRVGEAVFFITFPRKASYKGRLWVGLVRDAVMGQLGVSRLHAEGSDFHGDFRLDLDEERSNDAVKIQLNLYDRALVSPSFPVYQVRRAGVSVTYRLSKAMLQWFELYGGEYRGMRCGGEGFEGVFRKWVCALNSADDQIPVAHVMQVLTFLRANPFKTFERTF